MGDSSLGFWPRLFAGVSLTVSVCTLGAAPNAGGFIRAGDDLIDAASSGGGNYVYRGLAESDDISKGLFARAAGEGNDAMSHVAGAKNTQWISTTKDPDIAFDKYGEFGVVRIDLGKVPSQILDISGGFAKLGMLSNWARKDQEVLIRDHVPFDALQRFIR